MSIFLRKLPPLGTLVVFEAAYRLRNFSHAADEVALSQASVSRQINQLESNLGVKLFSRQRHDVVPTDEGEKFAASVRLSLQELAETAEQIRNTARGENVFTVFSDISIASTLIAPIISTFQTRYPETQLRVLSSYEPIQQVKENFDVGFQVGKIAEDLFDLQPIANDAVFPVCAPKFLAQYQQPLTAEQLAQQPLLHLAELGYDWPDWGQFLSFFDDHQFISLEGPEFNSYQICLEVAERGEGIALGWARSVETKLQQGKLVKISGLVMPIPESIFVYRRKLATPSKLIDEFVNLVEQNIAPLVLE